MKVDGSLVSLLQGVSQQPADTRLDGQCSLQENFSSNPIDGLTRRLPLDYIDDIITTEDPVCFKNITYGTNKHFLLAGRSNNLSVIDLQGNNKSCTITAGASYIPNDELITATIGYDTIICNKNIKAALSAETPSYLTYGSIVSVLGGQYSRTYKVTVSWYTGGTKYSVTGAYNSPDGTTTDDGYRVASSWICSALHNALAAITTYSFNTLFSISHVSDTLYIQWANPATTSAFEVTVEDGDGGTILLACNNKVGDVSKLPYYAPQGYYVVVQGAGNTEDDDYYLRYDIPVDSNGYTPAVKAGFGLLGTWRECSKTGEQYKLDTSTMPHVLAYNEDADTFTFNVGDWKERRAGDNNNNAKPSFIGHTINDLAVFQSRLVMASSNAVIMSRTNHQTDFWKQSATTESESDRIDMTSNKDGVSIMRRLVPHNRDLAVFSDAAQFIVLGRNAITPQNTSLVLSTTFEADLSPKPSACGRNVFFCTKYGQYVGVREFFTDSSADQNDARPITQHVLKYILGTAKCISSSSNTNVALFSCDGSSDVFVYEFLWQDQEKLQSSWSKWILPYEVVYHFIVESKIYFVMKDGTSYFLCKMDLDAYYDTGLTYQVHLDMKSSRTGVNYTMSDMGAYDTRDHDDWVFIQGPGCPNPGMRVLVASYDSGVITLQDDMQGGTVYFGIKYTSKFRPTMPSVKDASNNRVGILTISKFIVHVQNSGEMFAKKVSKYITSVIMKYTGLKVNSADAVVGEPVIVSEKYIVPFRDTSEKAELEIYTDSHLPLTISSIEWKGQYNKSGRHITTGGK